MQFTIQPIDRTNQIIEALNNRPDTDCSVVRMFKGVYYAVTSCSVWILKANVWDERFFWMTDYRKPEGFANMLFNMPEGDNSIPGHCDKGYLVVARDGDREEKFWYPDQLTAMAFATQDGAHPEFGECDILRIEQYDI